jgi:hypothetical protein
VNGGGEAERKNCGLVIDVPFFGLKTVTGETGGAQGCKLNQGFYHMQVVN